MGKYVIHEDELWPDYNVQESEALTDPTGYTVYELDDELVESYRVAYRAFIAARKALREAIDG